MSAKDGLQSEEKDPERIFKLKECCDMLLAGGYFRARIPTLSAFDKVVGGMVWSITGSGVDVDVDIIFQENSTIGQRIRLSDQLVKALIRMRSPHPLQSHQIQGLDYDHLFPVIQWLVRHVIEHRRLTGDLVRAQSLSSFAKSYALPSESRSEAAMHMVDDLAHTYARAQRKFRKKAAAAFDTPNSRTEGTLLEYGEQLQVAAAALGDDEERQAQAQERAQKQGTRNALIGKFEKEKSGASGAPASEKDAAARAEAEKREVARLAALRDQLSAVGQSGGKVSGANVGNIVGLQSEEIRRAAEQYEEMMRKQAEEMEAAGGGAGGGVRSAEHAHQRQLDALQRKIASAQETCAARAQAVAAVEASSSELSARVAKAEKRVARIAAEMAKLEELEGSAENRAILAQLRSLVQLNESLKAQEVAFKESCAAQRREYKALIAQLDPSASAAGGAGEDEETARMRAVERMYASELESLTKLRRVLARKNQELASLNRRLDDVPTRAELLQYERRFVELYELSSAKHAETKKFFALYNSTQQSHDFMQTELKLLNSIIEAFPSAVTKGTPKSKEEFLAKLESILEGVEANKKHVAAESEQVAVQRTQLETKFNALLEKQRTYFKAVKEFQDECNKNGVLEEAMANLPAASE